MTAPAAIADTIDVSLPWYRQVNRTQWNAFLASFLSWTLDGFDFTIVSFLLADLQTSFSGGLFSSQDVTVVVSKQE
jgi:MFS transporter, SHS family, sialic acid transporter